ncbi:MAG TPA: hypothetical protein VFI80_09130, partial [Burkholderiales bacterium]|nr:hypothetical protein [Burkholderiales bacterium]
MLFQHAYNAILLWGQYSLLALAFYFSSVGCRHFNFVAGVAFLIAPYVTLELVRLSVPWEIAIFTGLVAAGFFGLLYRESTTWMYRRGARPGQLLLVSLATLGIGENGLALVFGSVSRRLELAQGTFLTLGPVAVTGAQLVHISVALAVALGLLILWRISLIGKALRALLESRLGLLLRGYSVP